MAESPLAIRVNEETKELFNRLADESAFENKGEFLSRILTLYQAEETKQSVSMLKPAVEAVETLMSRLLEILNGAAAAITTNDEKHKQELSAQHLSFEDTRTLLQQRINLLEQNNAEDTEQIRALISDKEAAENKAKELQQRIKESEAAINDKQELINEYKEKLDTQTAIVSEYRQAAEENKGLHNDVNNLKQVNIGLQDEIDELKKEQSKQAELIKHEQDNLRNGLSIEKEAALLELKAQHQHRLEEQQTKHTAAINEYEVKVKDLLSLLEHEKTTPAKTTASRKKETDTKTESVEAQKGST